VPAEVSGDRADERIVKYRPATINLTVVPSNAMCDFPINS